ncbi:DUF4124 domain-containing protein [Thiocystis violacea]|uniref:DUF4124 domain-containing protein n=1 Tax=Thiocystis violacea TaxID=13725 RepID=UPI001903D028|nr:DUF4124 domain-containing protein [Thiocystis violacea]
MLRITLTICLLIQCSAINAEIYRWVDQDGRVHFSDRRILGSEKVGSGLPAPSGEEKASPLGPTSPDEVYPGPYSELEILSPTANQAFTQEADGLPVSLLINPALIEGHQMILLLNSTELPIKDASTQFKLTGTSVGSHRLQLQIRGADGHPLAQSAPRAFHLRKPKLPGQLP